MNEVSLVISLRDLFGETVQQFLVFPETNNMGGITQLDENTKNVSYFSNWAR